MWPMAKTITATHVVCPLSLQTNTETGKRRMIIRTRRPDRFAVIPNDALQNHALSFKARGLLAYLLSQPDDWRISSGALARLAVHDGRESIRTALKELETANYLHRRRTKDPDTGRFGWHHLLFDHPCELPVDNCTPIDRFPDAGKLNVLQSTNYKSEERRRHSYDPAPPLCKTCDGNGYERLDLDNAQRCAQCNGDGISRTP